MANTDPASLQDLMDAINTNVSNDSSTPTKTDDSDEWGARLNLIYMAIRIWGTTQDVLWNELWATYTLVATLSGTTTYVMTTLTDFRFPGGYLRLTLNGGTAYIPIIKSENAQSWIQAGKRAAYFTGSAQAGWTLNLTWTPASGDGTFGATVKFDYYKFPYKPPGTDPANEKIEMSDPNFVIFWVSAQKALLESQNNKFSVYDAQAEECLDNMRIMNDLLPDYQSNQVEDTDALNGAIMGE
jgi:hypothetical protein